MKNVRNITKTGSMGFYKANYSVRTHSSSDVATVERVKRVSLSDGDHRPSHEQIEAVYRKIRDVAREYRDFFISEQDLEKAAVHVDISRDEFIDELMEFLQLYNMTLSILHEFDNHFKTMHHIQVEEVMSKHSPGLRRISVVVEPDGHVTCLRESLSKRYAESPEDFRFLLGPEGMASQLIGRFRSVKAVILEESSDKVPSDQIHGMVIDIKL